MSKRLYQFILVLYTTVVVGQSVQLYLLANKFHIIFGAIIWIAFIAAVSFGFDVVAKMRRFLNEAHGKPSGGVK